MGSYWDQESGYPTAAAPAQRLDQELAKEMGPGKAEIEEIVKLIEWEAENEK